MADREEVETVGRSWLGRDDVRPVLRPRDRTVGERNR
jgi:hypothetical protein